MRVIVPLQGVVQGRGGLVLGSVIPCAFFYFLQFYLKRNRRDEPEPDPDNQNSASSPGSEPNNSDSSSDLTVLSRSLSRVVTSPRNSGAHVSVSGRANSILRGGDSPGKKRVEEDPYDELDNPDGIIELGLAQNKLSLDVFEDLVSDYSKEETSIGLSLSGIASYEPSDGLMELKMVVARLMSEATKNTVSFDPSQLVLTSGAAAAVEILSFCLADSGNAFLVPPDLMRMLNGEMELKSYTFLVEVLTISIYP